jgi:uroporphyrinogen decarboxylase
MVARIDRVANHAANTDGGLPMTSREIVRASVLFQDPPRIAHSLPSPWQTDFAGAGAGRDPDFVPSRPGADEWGCVWEKAGDEDASMGQVTVHPLADYAQLHDYPFPDYTDPRRYENARRVVEQNTAEKFVLSSIPLSLNHRTDYLRGFENLMMDPYLYPKEFGMLLDRQTDIAIDAVQRLAECGADAIMACDDWGLQDRTMMSPELFQRFFKPRYARVYTCARELGMLTFLHSCGHIVDILDDFIDAGLQVIQMDQQENMGIDLLAERFGGRIAFWCPVDIQATMVNGTLDDIRAYARRLVETLGCFGGGFISQWYASPKAVQHSQERINAMAEAFTEAESLCAG